MRNPCWPHNREKDGTRGIFCLAAFYILGPQKCGTTDTFERAMRHPDVLRVDTAGVLFGGTAVCRYDDPAVTTAGGEHLEPHLWTNQISEGRLSKGISMPLVFKYSAKQFAHHMSELMDGKIACVCT